MTIKRRPSRSTWLFLLLALALGGLYWWQLVAAQDQARREATTAAASRAAQLAAAVALQADTLFTAFDVTLQFLASEYVEKTLPEFATTARKTFAAFPAGAVVQVGVTDERGLLRYSDLPFVMPVDLAAHEHVADHLRGRAVGMQVGAPLLDPVAQQWTIPVSRPVTSQGRTVGVLVLSVAPAYVAGKLDRLGLATGDSVQLIRGDGWYLARAPELERALRSRAPMDRPYLGHEQQPGEIAVAPSQVDGHPRLLGWRQLQTTDAVAVVGIDLAGGLQALEASQLAARRTAAVATFMYAVAVLTLLVLLESLRRGRVQLEQRVAQRTAALSAEIAERERREVEIRKLSLALEQSGNSVMITDLDRRIEYVNEAFTARSGYRRDEVIGRTPRFLESGKTPPEAFARLREALAQGQPWQGEFVNRRKDGSEYTELASIVPLRQPDGRITHYVAAQEDITDRKDAEQALRAAKEAADSANRAKSRFLAHMSHEIRTPLNVVIGLAQVLEQDPAEAAKGEVIGGIRLASSSLLHIVNDILDLSKIEAGALRLDRQPFALADVLERVDGMLRGAAESKGLAFAVAGPAEASGVLDGDALRLEQVLVNLVANAIKFTDRGGVGLTVATLPADGLVPPDRLGVRLRFEVRDSGIGIAPEALAGLFVPFAQADSSVTRRFGGTGLGLAISRRLVEQMGGTLGATSDPGRGSTFWVELPFDRAVGDSAATVPAESEAAPGGMAGGATLPPAAPGAAQRLRGMRVLAVDDNRLNIDVLERILARQGARVTAAENGAVALQALRGHPKGWDAVLMDIQMPVMDGLTATRAIRDDADLADLPVLALSAGVLPEERAAAIAAGANGFLAKPVDVKQLVAALAALRAPLL